MSKLNGSFGKFIEEYQASPLTKQAYELSLVMFNRFLAGAEPTERKVEEFILDLQKKGLASGSVNRHLSAIRAYFYWRKKNSSPEKRGLYDLMVKGPKVHRKLPSVPTMDQVNRVLGICKTPYERALLMTLYDGALRIAELMGLDATDIDYGDSVIKVTGKGGDQWRIPVGDKTLKALRDYIGNREGQVFLQPYWRLRYDLRRLGNLVGFRTLNPHTLRHARASGLRTQGVALEDIKDFLRHKNFDTTLQYAHLEPTELKKRLPKAF